MSNPLCLLLQNSIHPCTLVNENASKKTRYARAAHEWDMQRVKLRAIRTSLWNEHLFKCHLHLLFFPKLVLLIRPGIVIWRNIHVRQGVR